MLADFLAYTTYMRVVQKAEGTLQEIPVAAQHRRRAKLSELGFEDGSLDRIPQHHDHPAPEASRDVGISAAVGGRYDAGFVDERETRSEDLTGPGFDRATNLKRPVE